MRRTTLTTAFLLLVVPYANAVSVNFDNLAVNTILGNQYPGVTISTPGGGTSRVYAYPGASSAPNILCTYNALGNLTCIEETDIDFATPTNSVTFWAIEPNNPGLAGTVDVFQNNVYTTTVPINGLGGAGNKFIDLSSFTNITRIQLKIDPAEFGNGGIGWDDFSYNPVPEPMTVLTLLVGFGVFRKSAVRSRKN